MSSSNAQKAFSIRSKQLSVYSREAAESSWKTVADGFVPRRVFDIHTHLVRGSDFSEANRPQFVDPDTVLGTQALREGLEAWLPGRELRALCFGVPARGIDRAAVNAWIAAECAAEQSWKALLLAGPKDHPEEVAKALESGGFAGIKVYHLFAEREGSFDCRVSEFAPEWMWDVLNVRGGILMLHIVKDRAMADPENQQEIRRLCQRYPNCKLVLAHVARSFSHRHALEGLPCLRDLDNAWVDTSAVCESQSFAAALDILGPARILFGSDYPISNLKGRCVTVGESFTWLYENTNDPTAGALNAQMTLVGIESLRALREAAERHGCTTDDLEAIFYNNAAKLLGGESATQAPTWEGVKEHISCGTGLMSKRREQFDPASWPTFFSRCHGSEVWDLSGRRFVDFAGGVGAIVLGYADEDVTRAVRRQLAAGTYCTLINPAEDTLARRLLDWHPWAGRVRFARGGGEAMTMAVRIARAATGRSGIAFCGYHGWQDWYLAANLSNDAALDGHLLPGLQPLGVPRELTGTSAPFFYNSMDSLREAVRALGGKPAAIVMEPMRSQFPKEGFLEGVKNLARETGAVFILDEVTSGLRFGFPGAHTRLGFEPDIAVYAKAMSNGFPFGTVIGREEIMTAAEGSFISSSYWTDAVGTSAALACTEKVVGENVSHVLWEAGLGFQAQLVSVAAAHPLCQLAVGGMPPAPSLSFGSGPEATARKVLMIRGLVRRGFLASAQLYLMHSHTAEQKSLFLSALDETLGDLDREIARGAVIDAAGTAGAANTFSRLA